MYTPEPDRDVTVEFHERSELPPPTHAQAAQVRERLGVLAGQGVIGAVEQDTWPSRAPLDDLGDALRDTYLSYRVWADDRGYSLAPFFQTRECFTPDRGGWTDWLVTPAFCLAVYEEDALSAIYPYADGAETHTVEDGVDALERALLDGPEQRAASAD